jgi:hypothetical protein
VNDIQIILDENFFRVSINGLTVGNKFLEESEAKRWVNRHITNGILKVSPEMAVAQKAASLQRFSRPS